MLLVALILVGVGAYQHFKATRDRSNLGQYLAIEFGRMPAELRMAQLVASERDMSAWLDGQKILVRPDQIYRTDKGLHVPSETKTRAAAVTYQYDVIELSLQRLAWAQKVGEGNVALHGYVRILPRAGAGARAPVYRRVDLLGEGELKELLRRYQAILAGKVAPEAQKSPAACRGCSHRKVCKVSRA